MSGVADSVSPKGTISVVPRTTPVDELREIIARDGGVVVRQLFTADEIDRLNVDIDPHMTALRAGGSPEETLFRGEFQGKKTKRLSNLVGISQAFREEWITNETLLAWVEAMLLPTADSYWMSLAQVIEIHPGQTEQILHRDQGQYPIFRSLDPQGPEVMVNALVALTEFTEEMGATRIIPGSNRWADFGDRGSPEMTIPVLMNPGDALLITGKVVHGGGANTTMDRPRRGLTFAFNAGFLVPAEAHPFILPIDLVRGLPPKVQNFLGFRSFHNEGHGGSTLWRYNYCELADYLKL